MQGTELIFRFDGEGNKEPKKVAYKVEITEVKDENGDGAVDLSDVRYLLQNDKNVLSVLQTGDFRSAECVELLKEADIVVTNPPFSLFREYIGQLMKYEKKFLIVGHQNAITYKEVFPLIKENKVWLGYGFKGAATHFFSPYEDVATAGNHKQNMIRVSGVVWFTNLEIPKRHEVMDLVCRYSGDDYPTYDNYDAIEVGRTADIPFDFGGIMGVPITFLDKYCPTQFEILGMCENKDLYGLKTKIYTSEECRNAYFDKFGRNGVYDLNASGVVLKNNRKEKVYQRLLIRNKHPKKS